MSKRRRLSKQQQRAVLTVELGGGHPKSRITLAGSKAPIGAARREHLVSRAMDVMRDWRDTPFESEGAMVAGLRSGLCLEGYAWASSDAEARDIVGKALRILGAVRPTWEQGQPEYVEPRENCAWCAGPVPDELLKGTFAKRFCSDVCARSFVERRQFEGRKSESKAYWSAYDIIQRSKNRLKPCGHCGDMFRPRDGEDENGMHGQYCSRRCVDASRRTIPDRPCKACGKVFRPRSSSTIFCSRDCSSTHQRLDIPLRQCLQCGDSFRPMTGKPGKFCSTACHYAHGPSLRIERDCLWCGATFVARSARARCCDHKCASILSSIKSGRFVPKRMNSRLLDYIMREQGARITDERMAA